MLERHLFKALKERIEKTPEIDSLPIISHVRPEQPHPYVFVVFDSMETDGLPTPRRIRGKLRLEVRSTYRGMKEIQSILSHLSNALEMSPLTLVDPEGQAVLRPLKPSTPLKSEEIRSGELLYRFLINVDLP